MTTSGTVGVTDQSGTGTKKVDTAELRVGSNTVERQVMVLGDAATSANYCTVTSGGALKIDGSGVTQPVSGTFWQTTQPVSIADGSNVTQGTTADAAYAGSGSTSIVGALKGIYNALKAALPAGSNVIGGITVADGSDQTQGAQADSAYAGSGSTSVIGALKGIYTALVSAMPAGSNVIGGVTQSGTWTVQPGNTANTTAWKVDGSAVTQPVSASSLPLPTGAATSANQPTAATQGSTTSGQTGLLNQGAVTTSAPTYTTAQTSPLSLTTGGSLRGDVSSYAGTALTGTVTAYGTAPTGNVFGVNAYVTSIAAGTNTIGFVFPAYSASSTGSPTLINAVIAPATPAATAIQGLGGGRLIGGHVSNSDTNWVYMKIFANVAASVTLGTTSPVMNFGIPPGTTLNLAQALGQSGYYLSGGCSYAITGGISLTDNTAITASKTTVTLFHI